MAKKTKGPDEANEVAEGRPGDQSAPADVASEAESDLERDLTAARAEAQDAADRALRTLAEFDNYRRRTEREREEVVTRVRADLLRELLEVADNFDRALEHAGDGVPASFLDGMKLVARGLHDLLDRKGVARIDAMGKPFDPEQHEALTTMEKEGALPDTVIQVVQSGYRVGDRVLRPAKVIVASRPRTRPDEPLEPAEDA
jgi:molecular chaperone GrpE